MNKPLVYAFIFARGGSKGVPRKNIRMLAGKPMIAYAIEVAQKSNLIDRIIVSTDDNEIVNIANEFGAETPFMRPKSLAQDESSEWMAWQHAIREMQEISEFKSSDIFVSLPPTSPLRNVEDINSCIDYYNMETEVDIVITVRDASRHPAFNMVTLDESQNASLLMPLKSEIHRRQDAPKAYDITTVACVTSPDFILKSKNIFDGKVKAIVIPEERAIDIDTVFEFEFANCLLKKAKIQK